jgi:hypothetical protein
LHGVVEAVLGLRRVVLDPDDHVVEAVFHDR